MKRGGGSNKGSSFERDICKQFSRWITNGERDDVFWRTAGSGARATVRQRRGQSTANSDGDMCCLDAGSEYAWFTEGILLEIRRGYNHWRLEEFLEPKIKKGGLVAYWREEVEKKARQRGKLPMLLWKPDRRPALFFLPCLHGYLGEEDYSIHLWGTFIRPDLHYTVRVGTTFFETQPEEIKGCIPCALENKATK
jgi:hypothetical protein